MTTLAHKLPSQQPARSRAGSVGFPSINLVSKPHFMDPKASKNTPGYVNVNLQYNSKQTLDSPNAKEKFRSSSLSPEERLSEDSVKSSLSQTSINPNSDSINHHEEPYKRGYHSPQLSRQTNKRANSLSTSVGVQARVNKSLSLPEGKIITHLNGRTKSDGSSDSDGATPIQNKRLKHVKSQKSMERRRMLYKKFQLYAKITVFCLREATSHILRNKAYDEISPYLNSLSFLEFAAGDDNELMFDVSKFKADKQLRISEEAKRILVKPTSERTEKELRYAQIALRNISSFAEYPMRMQRKIVEVGRYEKFDSKRVIVRQGHPASAFYFILSGSVVIMVYEGDTKVSKPVAYLRKGQTFGELAIIHRTTRQSTVVAKEMIELLSIDIEDFHHIFMAGGVKNITDPDHNDFLRSLPLLRTWPVERMIEQPDKCVFHYFKRGEVLVKDSNYSDWIFIVKSGSVQVLKKLKRVEAYETKNNAEGEVEEFKNERVKREERELREKQRRYILPDINIPLSSPVENEEIESQIPHVSFRSATHENFRYYPSGNIASRLQEIICKNSSKISPLREDKENVSHSMQPRHLPPIHRGGTFHASHSAAWHTMPKQTPFHLNGKSSSNLSNLMTMSLTDINTERVNKKRTVKTVPMRNALKPSASEKLQGVAFKESTSTIDTDSALSTPKSKRFKKLQKQDSRSIKNRQDAVDEKTYEELVDKKNNIRTITQDLDANYHSKDPDDVTQADLDPQFVHIQTLTKGQVFGVADLVLGHQPSFCLVSSGVECVMLNKDFYMQYASEALIRTLRLELSPYPSDQDMQRELQATIDWQAFKSNTFQSTVKHLGKVKAVSKA